jgi:hypothetical protein
MKAVQAFKMSASPVMQCHVQEGWNSQIHQCKNLKDCTKCATMKRPRKTNHMHARHMNLEFLAGGGIKQIFLKFQL